MSNRNRTAGIAGELKIAKELRELGFDKVVTTRSESKRMDDMGVDLIQLPSPLLELPCFFQIKKTLQTPSSDLLDIPIDKPLVIIHQKQKKKGKRFYTVGEYAIMKKELLYKLLKYVQIHAQSSNRTKN